MNYSVNDQLLIWLCPSILRDYTWAAHMLAVRQLSDDFTTVRAVKVKRVIPVWGRLRYLFQEKEAIERRVPGVGLGMKALIGTWV